MWLYDLVFQNFLKIIKIIKISKIRKKNTIYLNAKILLRAIKIKKIKFKYNKITIKNKCNNIFNKIIQVFHSKDKLN